MADVPQVTIVNGIPTAGSGTVQTISTTNAILGEVQASPTTNTLLERVKVLNTSIQQLVTALGSTALDLGISTAGSRTLRVGIDSAQTFGKGTAGTPSADVLTVQGVTAGTPLFIGGAIAHDGVDSGNPIKLGGKAIAHGTNPTAVGAADRSDIYVNRHGIPWVIGGHPNVIARAVRILDSDGAQTDASLVGTIAAGTKLVITQISAKADKNNSGNVAVKIGFGAANVPTPALAGVNGLIMDEDFGAGEGHQIGNGAGIIAIGGDGEELRITSDDPAGGNLYVMFSYYTVES